jgi:predicted ABC-type transport system involved in lysophospholipase L1 biosynthesis ATPase subunit
MVVATHDPSVAARADRTVELADGVLGERVRA